MALGAIADYYSRREPSSPVLPLVRQARALVGKSFHEIVTILVPSQVEKAASVFANLVAAKLPRVKEDRKEEALRQLKTGG